MLTSLFGNPNIAKILLFLFVNGKCYGAQLKRQLATPLTPLQNAFNRLEKGGILTSYCEGKTRLYQINLAYPLLSELELLLKKAYTLLTAQEKRLYHAAKLLPLEHKRSQLNTLSLFWQRLTNISKLTFSAHSKSPDNQGWNGIGKGEVAVNKESSSILIFTEKGSWTNQQGEEVKFSNIFRWTFDKKMGMIALEHLRRGIHQPVFLLHLVPAGDYALTSLDSHLCASDAYFGQVLFDEHLVRFNWRVIGAKKNEEIDYYYT